MAFSRTQQWLTAGFGLVLISLIGTALSARNAIWEQANAASFIEELMDRSEALDELLWALSMAESSQQRYFETQQEDALASYYQQIEIIESYRNELLLETLATEAHPAEGSAYHEALSPFSEALADRLESLEQGISPDSPVEQALTAAEQSDILQQGREDQLKLEDTLQDFLDAGGLEYSFGLSPEREIAVNNALWRISLASGIGALTTGILYLWLMQLIGRQEQQAQALEQENQTLSQSFKSQGKNLKTVTSSLETELSRRQEIETTYKEIEQAKELTDLKLNFFSLASHELRTPLSAILVSAQLLDNPNAQRSEEKRSRNLKRIQSSAKTMTQLLADILLLTRAEAGKLEFSPQRIELPDFCQRLMDEVKFNAQAHQQMLVQHQGSCDIAYLDNKLLRAMLMSLLTNSIKYSPQESEIQLTIIGEEAQVCFQIKDQGIGIPLADQQYLFESFRRGNNVEKTPGTGLGLAVVKKCLDLHGGSIELESQVGLGTTFIINIPWQYPA